MIQEVRQYLRDMARPLQTKYGLTLLAEFADIVVISCLFFTIVQISLSPAISRIIFPVSYVKADKRTRRNWDVHVVSLVHAFVAVILASRCLNAKSLSEDRAFGLYSDASFLNAIAVGYFIWDAVESIIHFCDVGFVVHGIACLLTFILATRPFLQYYVVRFLLWEVSTIFLNINWFLDKMGKTGSTLQLVNGFALLGTFLVFRLLWGAKMSYDFFVTLNGIYTNLPLFYIVFYGASNIVLQCLNWFWFTKMIDALRKRFSGKPAKGKSNKNGILNGNTNGKEGTHLD